MPNILFNESRSSRAGSLRPPSETRTYTLRGTSDQWEAYAYSMGAAPYIVGHINGTLYRQDVRLRPMGFQLWQVEIP